MEAAEFIGGILLGAKTKTHRQRVHGSPTTTNHHDHDQQQQEADRDLEGLMKVKVLTSQVIEQIDRWDDKKEQ